MDNNKNILFVEIKASGREAHAVLKALGRIEPVRQVQTVILTIGPITEQK